MTEGSSQGLFVVVAVVIFGIFVGISYLLFRENLTPSLSKIFCDSFIQVSKQTGFNTGECTGNNVEDNLPFTFKLSSSWGDLTPNIKYSDNENDMGLEHTIYDKNATMSYKGESGTNPAYLKIFVKAETNISEVENYINLESLESMSPTIGIYVQTNDKETTEETTMLIDDTFTFYVNNQKIIPATYGENIVYFHSDDFLNAITYNQEKLKGNILNTALSEFSWDTPEKVLYEKDTFVIEKEGVRQETTIKVVIESLNFVDA